MQDNRHQNIEKNKGNKYTGKLARTGKFRRANKTNIQESCKNRIHSNLIVTCAKRIFLICEKIIFQNRIFKLHEHT